MLLQMIDKLHAESIPCEKTLDFYKEVHSLAQAFLKPQPVMLRRGGSGSRMGHTVHAVLGMRVHRCHGRVFGV